MNKSQFGNPYSLFFVLLSCFIFLSVEASLMRMGKPPGKGRQIPSIDGAIPNQVKQADRKDTTANAQQILEQAKKSQDPNQRTLLKIKASKLLVDGKLLQQAKLVLSEIDQTQLQGDIKISFRLLVAKIAIAEQKPKHALKLAPPLPATVALNLRIESHKLRASAYRQIGNRLQSILELLAIAPLIKDENQTKALNNVVWTTLQQYSEDGLKQLSSQSQDPGIKAWFELALIYKQNRLAPEKFKQKIQLWKSQYSGHAAESSVLQNLATEQQAVESRPEKLALFLPLKGRIGFRAKAIRDGFIAAHYAPSNDRKNIEIKIYDTSANNDMKALYQKAIHDGAQMIIGPLKKNNVRQLLKIDELKVPVLTLNFLSKKETENKKDKLTFFGLSPEDEARQIAERAIFENKTRAIVLVPNTNWGGRIMRAFSERFKELGGDVREVAQYNSRKNDHRKTLHGLLNLDESYARYKSIAIRIQFKVKFEPRRRQDVDFVFVGAFPRQARLIVPQLKFYRASNLPIYTTSHVYTGVQDVRRDSDMNGIIFCDTPWTLSLYDNPSPIQLSIKQHFSHRLRGMSRLYAMGVDAYNVIPYLKWLKQQSHQNFQGQTGLLSIDSNNRIRRILKWAQFKKGKATIVQQQVIPDDKQTNNNAALTDRQLSQHNIKN